MGMIIQFQVCRGPWQHGTYFGGLVSLNSYPSESLGYIIYANMCEHEEFAYALGT